MGVTYTKFNDLLEERLRYNQSIYERASVFYPNPKQKEVYDCECKRIIVKGGRKSGKTATEVYRIITQKDRIGEISVVYTLTNQAVRDIWIKEFEKQRPPGMEIIYHRGLIKLPNGGEVWLKHGQNFDSATLARGVSVATHFVFDEHAWNAPDLWTVVAPNTLPKKASVVFVSSPWIGHFYDLYKQAKDIENSEIELPEDKKTWRVFDRSSFDGTPNGTTDEEWAAGIYALKPTMPQLEWEVEIEGRFPEESGDVFKDVNEAYKDNGSLGEKPASDITVAVGLDVARKNDKTAMVAIDKNCNVWVLMNGHTAFSEWEGVAKTVRENLNDISLSGKIWLDNTGIGDGVRGELARQGIEVLPVIFNAVEEGQAHNNKTIMVTNLQIAFENHKLKIAPGPLGEELRRQLLAYTYKLNETTHNISFSKPSGYDDDLVDALLLAYTCALRQLNKPQYRPLNIEPPTAIGTGIFGKGR